MAFPFWAQTNPVVSEGERLPFITPQTVLFSGLCSHLWLQELSPASLMSRFALGDYTKLPYLPADIETTVVCRGLCIFCRQANGNIVIPRITEMLV